MYFTKIINNYYMKNTDLNRFNNGGSHASNPLGGIPLGKGINGKTNTVQQNETSKGDFIFSNDVILTKDVIEQFNLPKSLEGKTIADATKVVDNKFKDRNDKISLSTKTGMLDGIASAQEIIKAKQQNLANSFEANSTEVPDMMNGQVPQGFEGFAPQQNQMFLGGFGGGGASTTGTGMNMLQGAGKVGNSMGSAGFEERYNYDPKLKQQYNQMEGVKDSIGQAFPIAGIFRGIEKGGKAIGQSIGGDSGGDIASGILDPFSGQMETFKNKDSTGWEKAAVVAAPFLSGVIASYGRKRTARREAGKQHIMEGNTEMTNDFAKGGNLRPKINSVLDNPNLDEMNLNNNLASQYYFDNLIKPKADITTSSIPTTTFEEPNMLSRTSTMFKEKGKKSLDWLGDNAGNIMRYAPVAMNALQLAKMKRPHQQTLNRLDNKFIPDYVDERSMQNIVGNEFDNVSNSLAGATNGSQGALRSNLLGASLNRTKAMSDAYLNASAQNRAQNLQGQQFNANIDQINLGQANQELDINDRNQAAYDTNKSKLQSALSEDIGNIGKEEVYKKIAKEMFGYKWNGKYYIAPDGSKISPEEVKAEVDSKNTNTAKLGGMFIKNKMKY